MPSGISFADAESTYNDADICIYGIPYDHTACFKAGAREGPNAIRRCSYNFEQTHFEHGKDQPELNVFDYGDCGRAMRRMLRDIDAPYRERIRSLRFAAAHDALHGHPELQRTLSAIRRHRRREKIAAALDIPVETYVKRFARICQILGPLLA